MVWWCTVVLRLGVVWSSVFKCGVVWCGCERCKWCGVGWVSDVTSETLHDGCAAVVRRCCDGGSDVTVLWRHFDGAWRCDCDGVVR